MGEKLARLVTFAILSMATVSASSTPITNGLELWLDASTLDSSTTSVSTWSDQSGNGRDVTSSGAGSSPTYVAANSLFSNRPTVSFDGADFLTTSALASAMSIDGNNARTIFFVFSQDATSSRNILGYGTNSTFRLFDIAAASEEISGHFHGTPFVNGTQTLTLNQMTVGTARYDGSSFQTFQHDENFNGQTSSSSYTLDTGDTVFNVGGGVFPSYNYFNGDIAEILVYSGSLTDTDRGAVDDYLFTKYTSDPPANPTSMPEPTTLALLGVGVVGIGFSRRRRRH